MMHDKYSDALQDNSMMHVILGYLIEMFDSYLSTVLHPQSFVLRLCKYDVRLASLNLVNISCEATEPPWKRSTLFIFPDDPSFSFLVAISFSIHTLLSIVSHPTRTTYTLHIERKREIKKERERERKRVL
jgi:hypothetical protein